MAIQTFIVSPNIPLPARTLGSFVQAQLKISRSQSETIIHGGAVTVNKRVAVQNHLRLDVDDEVVIDYIPQPVPTRQSNSKLSKPDLTDFEILYDDDYIIVVDKPAGLLTVPTPYREKQTMIGLLERYHRKRRNGEQMICVQRLDRGVSGVLVFCKSLPVGLKLREQFAARKPSRQYIALVAGQIAEAEGSYRSYMATDKDLNRYSTGDSEIGQLAITHWKRHIQYADATMLQVQLETGRRNQIRVHLAEDGHPIIGDPRYETSMATHSRWNYKRIALHAESLGFRHPETDEAMMFKTDWPQEFRTFHRQMKRR